MASLNKLMLIGRLTDNPEPPRTLPNSGSRVIKFSFAVGRSKKNPQTGQWESDPNPLFIDCEAFSRPDTKRDLVSLLEQYAKKGDQMYIEGRLQLDRWDDKTTGQKRSKHKMVVDSVEFLGTRQGGEGGGGGMAGAGMAAGRPVPARSNYGPDDHGGDYPDAGGSSSEPPGEVPF